MIAVIKIINPASKMCYAHNYNENDNGNYFEVKFTADQQTQTIRLCESCLSILQDELTKVRKG